MPPPPDSSGEEAEQQQQHQDSIFSRLEELRFKLEQLMGFENFIEAYNKIKVRTPRYPPRPPQPLTPPPKRPLNFM